MNFLSALSLLFVAAKLFGFAQMSWFVAFSPMIIGVTVALLMAVLQGILEALKQS